MENRFLLLLIVIVFSAKAMEDKDVILREARNLEAQVKSFEEKVRSKDALENELRSLVGSTSEETCPGVSIDNFLRLFSNFQKTAQSLDVEGKDLVKRSESLALRAQDSGLEKEGIMRVNYNPKMNSIVAWNHRSGSERSVTITVIKYLATGEFDVDASVDDGLFDMMSFGKADPSIVGQLKEKIAEFEATMPKN